METPITLTIPMNEPVDDAKCMYLDSSGTWRELEQPELNEVTPDGEHMKCYSTHLTTFTL